MLMCAKNILLTYSNSLFLLVSLTLVLNKFFMAFRRKQTFKLKETNKNPPKSEL